MANTDGIMLMQKNPSKNDFAYFPFLGLWYDIIKIENSLTARKTNSLPKEIVCSLNESVVFIPRVAVLS